MKLYTLLLLGSLILMPLQSFCLERQPSFDVYIVAPLEIFPEDPCNNGIYVLPDRRFAIQVFCDDAMGVNVAVIHLKAEDGSTGWPNNWERFWQSREWGSDVTGCIASAKSDRVFIATSEVYGSGSLYMLDLERKESTDLLKSFYASRNVSDCTVAMVSHSSTSLEVVLTCEEPEQFRVTFSFTGELLNWRQQDKKH